VTREAAEIVTRNPFSEIRLEFNERGKTVMDPVTIVTICDDWEFPTVTEQHIEKTGGNLAFPGICDGVTVVPISLSYNQRRRSIPRSIPYFNPKEKNNRHNCHIVTNRINTNTCGVTVENPTVTMFTPTVTVENTAINSNKWRNTLKKPLIWTELKMLKCLKINNMRKYRPCLNGLKHSVHVSRSQRHNGPDRAYITENGTFSAVSDLFCKIVKTSMLIHNQQVIVVNTGNYAEYSPYPSGINIFHPYFHHVPICPPLILAPKSAAGGPPWSSIRSGSRSAGVGDGGFSVGMDVRPSNGQQIDTTQSKNIAWGGCSVQYPCGYAVPSSGRSPQFMTGGDFDE
jgi:hypothetical protein